MAAKTAQELIWFILEMCDGQNSAAATISKGQTSKTGNASVRWRGQLLYVRHGLEITDSDSFLLDNHFVLINIR